MSRVLVAMSGGVDSSACAAKLIDEGYECVGVTMRMLCTSKTDSDIQDAKDVCDKLGIEHVVIDTVDDFDEHVISKFVEGYELGTTPNPCILCNRELKFGKLWRVAQELNCDYLATGHYARIEIDDKGQAHALMGVNELKDQSYVLWVVPQDTLKHVLLPLGDIESKDEVRRIAREHGLELAEKGDSQDICFVEDGKYPEFMREYTGKDPVPGPIIDEFGQEIGIHRGLTSYTLGQRKGVGVSAKRKIYVLDKIPEDNTLVVGDNTFLYSSEFYAHSANWVSGIIPDGPQRMQIVSHYHGYLFDATVTPLDNNRVKVVTDKQVRAVSPGQSVVGYLGNEVIFGGIIEKPKTPISAKLDEIEDEIKNQVVETSLDLQARIVKENQNKD